MAHPVEEGSGAPSFRPLWRLMPYLWPQGRPDLKARVVVSILFLMLGIVATTVSQQFLGAAVDAFGTTPRPRRCGWCLRWWPPMRCRAS